jgi:hypothetical protein
MVLWVNREWMSFRWPVHPSDSDGDGKRREDGALVTDRFGQPVDDSISI